MIKHRLNIHPEDHRKVELYALIRRTSPEEIIKEWIMVGILLRVEADSPAMFPEEVADRLQHFCANQGTALPNLIGDLARQSKGSIDEFLKTCFSAGMQYAYDPDRTETQINRLRLHLLAATQQGDNPPN